MFASRKKRAAARANRLADDSSFGLHSPRMTEEEVTDAKETEDVAISKEVESPSDVAQPDRLGQAGGKKGVVGNTILTTITGNGLQGKEQAFVPKQSERAKNKRVTADNDVWQEELAVVEMINPSKNNEITNVVRSYFVSSVTGAREWDEPPSGASNVEYATEQMHEMAKAQLDSIVADMDAIGVEKHGTIDSEPSKKKTKGLKRVFKRKSSTEKADVTEEGKAAQPRIKRSEVYSRQMQRAMAMSLKSMSADCACATNESDENDEDLALAKALSLSENVATKQKQRESQSSLPLSSVDLSSGEKEAVSAIDPFHLFNSTGKNPAEIEEEMIRRAIEESKSDMLQATSKFKREESLLLDLSYDNPNVEENNEVVCSSTSMPPKTATAIHEGREHESQAARPDSFQVFDSVPAAVVSNDMDENEEKIKGERASLCNVLAKDEVALNQNFLDTCVQKVESSEQWPCLHSNGNEARKVSTVVDLLDLVTYNEIIASPYDLLTSEENGALPHNRVENREEKCDAEEENLEKIDATGVAKVESDRTKRTQDLLNTRIQVSQISLCVSTSKSFDSKDSGGKVRGEENRSSLLKVSAVGGRRKQPPSQRWSMKSKLSTGRAPFALAAAGKSETTELA